MLNVGLTKNEAISILMYFKYFALS